MFDRLKHLTSPRYEPSLLCLFFSEHLMIVLEVVGEKAVDSVGLIGLEAVPAKELHRSLVGF
jgi:hypothetical protein